MPPPTFGFGEFEAGELAAMWRWWKKFTQSSPGMSAGNSRGQSMTGHSAVPAELVGDTNVQSGASYAIDPSDWGQTLEFTRAGAVAVSIAQAGIDNGFPQRWWCEIAVPVGKGPVTITPTTSDIAGGSSYLVHSGQSIKLSSDGNKDSDGGHYKVNNGRAYHTIQENGTSKTQRPALNLIPGFGVGISVADNSANQRTNATISVVTGYNLGTLVIFYGTGTTTDTYSDNIILDASLPGPGRVSVNNTGGATLAWQVTAADYWGGDTPSGTLAAGSKRSWDILEDIGTVVGPFTGWKLEVKSNTVGVPTTFECAYHAVGAV